jgi:hypothetical protein
MNRVVPFVMLFAAACELPADNPYGRPCNTDLDCDTLRCIDGLCFSANEGEGDVGEGEGEGDVSEGEGDLGEGEGESIVSLGDSFRATPVSFPFDGLVENPLVGGVECVRIDVRGIDAVRIDARSTSATCAQNEPEAITLFGANNGVFVESNVDGCPTLSSTVVGPQRYALCVRGLTAPLLTRFSVEVSPAPIAAAGEICDENTVCDRQPLDYTGDGLPDTLACGVGGTCAVVPSLARGAACDPNGIDVCAGTLSCLSAAVGVFACDRQRFGAIGESCGNTNVVVCPPNATCDGVTCVQNLPEICDNGFDDNADAQTDCFDGFCFDSPSCIPAVTSDLGERTAPTTVTLPFFGNVANAEFGGEECVLVPVTTAPVLVTASTFGGGCERNQSFADTVLLVLWEDVVIDSNDDVSGSRCSAITTVLDVPGSYAVCARNLYEQPLSNVGLSVDVQPLHIAPVGAPCIPQPDGTLVFCDLSKPELQCLSVADSSDLRCAVATTLQRDEACVPDTTAATCGFELTCSSTSQTCVNRFDATCEADFPSVQEGFTGLTIDVNASNNVSFCSGFPATGYQFTSPTAGIVTAGVSAGSALSVWRSCGEHAQPRCTFDGGAPASVAVPGGAQVMLFLEGTPGSNATVNVAFSAFVPLNLGDACTVAGPAPCNGALGQYCNGTSCVGAVLLPLDVPLAFNSDVGVSELCFAFAEGGRYTLRTGGSCNFVDGDTVARVRTDGVEVASADNSDDACASVSVTLLAGNHHACIGHGSSGGPLVGATLTVTRE